MTVFAHFATRRVVHMAVTARRQAGVVLIAALIALVAVTLAGIALVRSVDTGLAIAGNAAFKGAATAAADVAIDAGVKWLIDNKGALSDPVAASGYYANWMSGCDMTGNRTRDNKNDDVNWDGTNSGNSQCVAWPAEYAVLPGAKAVNVTAGMPAGFNAAYITTRMCYCDGPANGYCSSPVLGSIENACQGVATKGRFHGTPDYVYRGLSAAEAGRISGSQSPYYRIVARVVGPRNTTSFVEAVVTLE